MMQAVRPWNELAAWIDRGNLIVGAEGVTAVGESSAEAPASTGPGRAPLVLLALILVAAVANLNLSVANVALPSIGQAFGSSQTDPRPDRGGLFARPRRVGPVPGRAR